MVMRKSMEVDDQGVAYVVVPLVAVCCPQCGRFKPHTWSVRDPVRMHRCKGCGLQFKSIRKNACDVRGFEQLPQCGSEPRWDP